MNAHLNWEGTHLVFACAAFVHPWGYMQVRCSFPCAHLNFFHFIPSTCSVHKLKRTIIFAFDCVLLPDFIISPSHTTTTTTTLTMPPRHNKQSPQPKHNRSNAPVYLTDGFVAKQRGEDSSGTWKLAKNMTIRDPSQIISSISSATNTHITYDNKFEFRFWGSLDNVWCSLSICDKPC